MQAEIEDKDFRQLVSSLIESAIKISLIAIIVIWCFQIIKPFVSLVLWGGILAIALFPVFTWLKKRLNHSNGLTATLIALPLVLLIIVPMLFISESLIEKASSLVEMHNEGQLVIPSPSEKVAEWPLVGEKLYSTWNEFAENTEAAAKKFLPQIKTFGNWLLSASANTALMTLLSIASIILAAFFITKAESVRVFFVTVFNRFHDTQGEEFLVLSIATIRSVAQGVIGIAIIQALLATPGLLLMGIPAAGLIILAVLVVAIIQVPTLVVLGPIMAYAYSMGDATSATIFSIYMLLVGLSDNVLKPLLLGRGVDVPMLVILLGAIGGMIFSGIIGLFTGAVVLALGYVLFRAWLYGVTADKTNTQPEQSSN